MFEVVGVVGVDWGVLKVKIVEDVMLLGWIEKIVYLLVVEDWVMFFDV